MLLQSWCGWVSWGQQLPYTTCCCCEEDYETNHMSGVWFPLFFFFPPQFLSSYVVHVQFLNRFLLERNMTLLARVLFSVSYAVSKLRCNLHGYLKLKVSYTVMLSYWLCLPVLTAINSISTVAVHTIVRNLTGWAHALTRACSWNTHCRH